MNLEKLLNIKYPIIQGGMANITDGKFASIVSNLGALGVIGSGGMSPLELEREIKICKSLTKNPFGVNLMLLNPDIDKMIDIVINQKVKIVTTGAGNPGKYIDKLHKEGIKVLPVVGNLTLAKRMEKLGVDAVIAEGMEAGGHIGNMTTMTLLPELKKNLSIPIIAAGGIASGDQILACKIMGASGVQIGSILLASKECKIHKNYKEKLLNSKSNNIVVIGQLAGIPIRVIKNSMTREYVKREKEGFTKEELEKYTLGALKRSVIEGDIKNGSLMCGLSIGQIDKIKSLEEIIKTLIDEYLEELEKIKNEN